MGRVGIVLLLITIMAGFAGADPKPVAGNDWLNPDYRYRVRLDVDQAGAGSQPVEVEMDFTRLIREAGGSGAFDENSIRVVRMHSAGPPLNKLFSQG